MKKKIPYFIVLFALYGFLISCGGSGGPYVPVTHTAGWQPLQHEQRIVILDRNVKDVLLYVNSVQKRLPRGHILVQANFQSRFAKEDVWAEVKIVFYDENNMVVDETEWMNTHFPAWEVTMVQGNSISHRAMKHVMLLKNLRNRSGKLPRTRGMIFEIHGPPSVLPK